MKITALCLALITSLTACYAGGGQICPFCQEPVIKDTATIDNSVNLVVKGKATPYKCLLCAIADAKAVKGDLEIDACSDKKGDPIKLLRKDGKWSTLPEGAVFAYSDAPHDRCELRYRAMHSKDAFEVYEKAVPKAAGPLKMLTLDQFIDKCK